MMLVQLLLVSVVQEVVAQNVRILQSTSALNNLLDSLLQKLDI